MKPLFLFASLAAMAWLSARGAAVAQNKNVERQRAINVNAGIQQWLQIYSDGAGTVGFGAGGSYQGHFKSGTFDVKKITKELKDLPIAEKGDWRTHYSYNFESQRQAPDKPGPQHYTLDRKFIPALFAKAIQASGKKKEDFPKGFGELKASPGGK